MEPGPPHTTCFYECKWAAISRENPSQSKAARTLLILKARADEVHIDQRAGDRIRTDDNDVGNVVLYQLSYTRNANVPGGNTVKL